MREREGEGRSSFCRPAKHWRPSLGWSILCLTCLTSCRDTSAPREGPCYVVEERYASGLTVADTVAAKEAFNSYLDHLAEVHGYPVDDLISLSYDRAGGTSQYMGVFYWDIVALGRTADGLTGEVRDFRVRPDGVVVSMLTCI